MNEGEVLYQLANCELMRLDVDEDHYYYGALPGEVKEYYLSVTQILSIGGPFPENLREWLRSTSADESRSLFESRGARGTKLHDALHRLLGAEEIDLTLYPSTYEKDALVTFIRVMRFLQPTKIVTEEVVADPTLKIAGTIDLRAIAPLWKLKALLDPNKYLEIDSDNDLQLKEKWLDLPDDKTRVSFIWDHKFTSVNAYNHEIQVAAYRYMYGKSHKGTAPTMAFTWRFSPKHKFGFDFKQSDKPYKAFTRIYDTTIDYLGEFPAPPTIKRFPSKVRLYNIKEEV